MSISALPWGGRIYVAGVVVLGAAILGHAAVSIFGEPIGWNWFVLAALTLLTGSATVKLPSVPATISISETFVITSTLLYGPSAGTLTVALDALVISFILARRGHPAYRVTFNICALPASLWVAAKLFFGVSALPPLASIPPDQTLAVGSLLWPLLLFSTCYFALNSSLIAIAIAIERRISPYRIWRENFALLSLNYFGGASMAALLVAYARDLDYGFIGVIVPLLAVLYFTFWNAMGRVQDTNRHLVQLNSLYMSTIETLAMAIDAKDQITHGHIRRVQQYAVALAKKVGIKESAQISAIEAASLLHDMGKLAVPEYILNKPGALTPAEFDKMKLHASVGADILSAIDFPYPVVPIVRHHHENWDGTGYPDGIRGTDIPIGARILSVVDCFDALTSDRPYRPRLPDSEAIRILLDRRGKMYDPVVVDAFIALHEEMSASTQAPSSTETSGFAAIAWGGNSHGRDSKSRDTLEQINASTEETVAMFELARSLSGRLTFAAAGEVIAKHLRRIVPASTCVLYEFVDSADELSPAFSAGEHSALFTDLRIPRGERLTGWIAANHQTALNSDPVLDLGETARSVKPPLRSYLGTSVRIGDRLIGVLAVYSPQRAAFTEDHQRILESVARQAAGSLEQAASGPRDAQRSGSAGVELLAESDLEEVLRTHTEQKRGEISLMLIDLPSLSEDRSPAPEAVVRAVASVLRERLRATDYLYRVGSATIVAAMPGVAQGIASEVAERTVAALEDIGFSPASPAISVASFPLDGRTVRQLVYSASQREERIPTRPSIH